MSGTAEARVRAAYAAIDAADRPEVWITLRPEAELVAEARDVDARTTAGERLPLAGLLLAVKNNVDVAGIRTTAACPGFGEVPTRDATAVARLRAAGALVLGATNLDQFATGLVGTRSPFGAVRDARRPDRISGGSSSGSAVAVALGLADLAIGTDTAGSGRVPAGLQGIVGIKPTLGVVPTDGLLPACPSWDAITVFARDLSTAELAAGIMAGGARAWPANTKLAAPSQPRVAYPDSLPGLSGEWRTAFERVIHALEDQGARTEPIPFEAFLDAARMLYESSLVAERYAAVGAYLDAQPEEPWPHGADPTVTAIVRSARTHSAHAYVADRVRLEALRTEALARLEGFDALVIPTAPRHPTLAEVEADPVGVNSLMGTYTNFCNLFDLSAVAVPAGAVCEADGEVSQFGVTVVAGAFEDAVAADVARRIEQPAEPPALLPRAAAPAAPHPQPWPVAAGARAVPLVVVGAHRRGQALVHELEELAAAWDGEVRTAPEYRMLALETRPQKPGLIRSDRGAELVGERWLLSPAALGEFLAELPRPMLLGRMRLVDGSECVGFACDAVAAAQSEDITDYRDWLAWQGR
ncbi:allophanate hydrolase [Sinomonas sp.]|uniref:allophanate hydrolase n=1 Tax=Sinomonas sp. TaxID=1914986 RepID=UPI002FDFCAAB